MRVRKRAIHGQIQQCVKGARQCLFVIALNKNENVKEKRRDRKKKGRDGKENKEREKSNR